MKNSLLKQIITLLVLFATGLFFLLGVPQAQHPIIEIEQWKIFPSLYSISITHNQNPEDFYKISPYDDVIFYEDGSWDKVIHGNEQILNDNLVNPPFLNTKIIYPLRAFLKRPKVGFVSKAKGISYQAYRSNGKLVVKKKLGDLPKKAIGFGNSFVFSKNDEIFDSQGRKFLLSELKEDRTEITGVSSLVFRNPKSTGQIVLPLKPDQKVILDKIYRLVEVKVELPEAIQEINVVQEILLEKKGNHEPD